MPSTVVGHDQGVFVSRTKPPSFFSSRWGSSAEHTMLPKPTLDPQDLSARNQSLGKSHAATLPCLNYERTYSCEHLRCCGGSFGDVVTCCVAGKHTTGTMKRRKPRSVVCARQSRGKDINNAGQTQTYGCDSLIQITSGEY